MDIKKELIYAIENCYSNDVLLDLHNLLLKFDSNASTSSLKKFTEVDND